MFKTNVNRRPNKAHFLGTCTLMLGMLLPATLSSLTANATDMGNGRTIFDRAPKFVRVAASDSSPNIQATYQFTIEVPKDAGESLKAIRISQRNNLDRIEFDMSESHAFMGDSFAGGKDLPLANIGGRSPSDSSEVTVVFQRPVTPGSTVTVSLMAKENPRYDSVYHFGVTAFSVGRNSPALYLGTRSLSFDISD